MITYLYWIVIVAIAAAVLAFFVKSNRWKPAIIGFVGIIFLGFLAYYFHFQQVFVKRYGGVMALSVPDGHRHIAATWKGDNLWIENYDPETNTCYFNEYSKGNLLQGKVKIKNCNPIATQGTGRVQPKAP